MTRTTISLPEDLLRQLRRMASDEGTSMASLVSDAFAGEGQQGPAEAEEPRGRRITPLGYGPTIGPEPSRAALVALILDTGPLYAALDRSDADHRACRAWIEGTEEPVVIPSPVLVEIDYWIHVRLHAGVLEALLDDILAARFWSKS